MSHANTAIQTYKYSHANIQATTITDTQKNSDSCANTDKRQIIHILQVASSTLEDVLKMLPY